MKKAVSLPVGLLLKNLDLRSSIVIKGVNVDYACACILIKDIKCSFNSNEH